MRPDAVAVRLQSHNASDNVARQSADKFMEPREMDSRR